MTPKPRADQVGRCRRAAELHRQGLGYFVIGQRLGVSAERARQMVAQGEALVAEETVTERRTGGGI